MIINLSTSPVKTLPVYLEKFAKVTVAYNERDENFGIWNREQISFRCKAGVKGRPPVNAHFIMSSFIL